MAGPRAPRRASFPAPALVLVTDSSRRPPHVDTGGEAWLDDVVREAVLGGVNVVQLREKSLPHGELIALGLHVRDAIAGRALLFVNGDIEAALALGADGVHLPEDGPDIAAVRARAGEALLISRAVHSAGAAARAEASGADIAQFGTVFETASKPGASAAGLDALREVCAAVRIPVVAIGGIAAGNAASVLHAGAAGIAVIGAIFDASGPRAAAASLREAIDGASAT